MTIDDDKNPSDGLDQQIRENLRRVFEENSKSSNDDHFSDLIEQIRKQDRQENKARTDISDQIIENLPDLRGFARSLTRNRDSAEDLVQETFAKALSNIDKFKEGTNLRAWLFTILRNHFYSTMRKGKREVEDTDGIAASKLIQVPNQEARMAFEEFREAFQKLPADQREALMLVGVNGFSYEEAAETCNCAIGTIKSRVNRGRVKLAEVMGMSVGETIETPGIAAQSTMM